MKTLLTLLAFLFISAHLNAQQNSVHVITSGGRVRSFEVHLPSAAPAANLPVVICYHGTGGTAEAIAATTGFNAFADLDNFIVVYPQSEKIGNDDQWNVYVDNQPGHAGV